MTDIVERLRSSAPLPLCPFEKRSPEYWTTPNDKPCKFCGGLPEGPDKCTGADMRILLEAADEVERLEARATAAEATVTALQEALEQCQQQAVIDGNLITKLTAERDALARWKNVRAAEIEYDQRRVFAAEARATAAESLVRDLEERLAKAETARDTYEEILRCVCHHLELPQYESGPADDLRLYDRALEAADLYTRQADKDLAENQDLRFKAEAEVFRLREALKPFADEADRIHPNWASKRRLASLTPSEELTVEDFRRARTALTTIRSKA